MASDLELLFRIKSDSTQATSDIQRLRYVFGAEFGQIGKVGQGALQGVNQEITNLARSVPVIGAPLAGVTRAFLTLKPAISAPNEEAKLLNKTLSGLTDATGKSRADIVNFSKSFIALKTDAEKTKLVLKEFGNEGATLFYQFEKVGAGLTKTGQEATALSGATSLALTGIGALTVAGVASLAVGFKLADSYAEQGKKLFILSEQTGITTENLSGLDVGARKIGVTLDSLTPSFNIYLKNVSEAAHGNTAMSATFTRFGIDAKKAVQDPNQAIEMLVKTLGGIENAAERADAGMKLAGRGAKSLGEIAFEADGSLAGLRKTAAELGVSFSYEDAKAAKNFEDQLSLLKVQAEGVGYSIAKKVMPDIQDALGSVSKSINENKGEWEGLGSELKTFVADTLEVVHALSYVALGLSKVGEGLDYVYKKVSGTPQVPEGYNYSQYVSNPDVSKQIADDFLSSGDRIRPGVTNPDIIAALQATGHLVQRRNEKPTTPYSPGIGDVAHKSRGGAKAEDAASKDEIKLLEIQQRTQERIYREATEKIEREYKIRAGAVADYVQAEKEAAAEVLKAQLATVDAEIKAAEKLHKGRTVKLAELNEKRAALISENNKTIHDIEDKGAAEEIETLRARQDAIYRIHEEADKQAIASYQYAADKRLISAETAEKLIGQVELTALEKKKFRVQQDLDLLDEQSEAYKKLHVELGVIEAERGTLEEDIARRIHDAHERDLQEQREYNDKLHALELEVRQRALDVGQARIGDMERHHESRSAIIRRQLDLDIASEALRHEQELDAVRQMEAEDFKKARTLDDFLQVLKRYHGLVEIENQRHADANQRTEEKAYADKNRGAVSGVFRGARPQVDEDGNITKQATAGQNAIAGLTSALSDARAMGKATFNDWAQGMGQTLSNFVLLGETGPQALRKVTAQALASAASESLVKGIMATADGFVHLFTNPAQSAADFTAAGLYFAIAGGAALAGRKAAGNLFKGNTGASAGGALGYGAGDGASAQPYRPFNYNSQTPSASEANAPGSRTSLLGQRIERAAIAMEQAAQAQHRSAGAQMASAQQVSRLQTIDAGQVVTMGALGGREAIGDAMEVNFEAGHTVTRKVVSLGSTGRT